MKKEVKDSNSNSTLKEHEAKLGDQRLPVKQSTMGKYAYYSGIGFQMIGVIGAFTFLGHWIDGKQGNETAVWTAILALLGVCLSIFTTIRMLVRKK